MTVMIVDDDPLLLKAMTLFLTRLDYVVIPVSSSKAAIQKSHDLESELDLIIADLTLDDCSGMELVWELRRKQNSLKALIVSGYPIEAWDEYDTKLFDDLPSRTVQVLLKPFPSAALLNSVTHLIASEQDLTQTAGQYEQ
jgi:DNA-binding response OmpR family regulator